MCRLIMSLVITVFAVGCSTIQEQTKFIISTTVFHGTDHAKRGTIAVKPLDKIQEGSLEFKAVSEYLTNSMKVLVTKLKHKLLQEQNNFAPKVTLVVLKI